MRKIIALLVFLMLVSGCASSLLYNHYPPKTQAEFNSDSYDCNYIATNSGHSHSTLGVILDATFYNGEFRKCMEQKYGYVVEKEKNKESSKSVTYSDKLSESSQSQKNYCNSDGHFSLIIPDDWEEVPKADLDNWKKTSEQQQGKKLETEFIVAFQQKNKKKLIKYLAYPHMKISIDKQGKLSESQIQQFTGLSKGELEEQLDPKVNIINLIEVDKAKYIKDKNAIIMKSKSHMQGVGNLMALAYSMLSNYGAVNLYFYTTESSFQNDSKYFNQIVDSFKFDESYGYVKALSPKSDNSACNWRVCVKVIVLKSENKAKEILNRLLKGESFELLAKKYSIEKVFFINCVSIDDVKKWNDKKAFDFFFNPELKEGILDNIIHKREDGNYYISKFYKVID